MKTVQDKDGNIIEVADDTPCHAGKNGALPIMLDPILDKAIFDEMAERDATWKATELDRKKDKIRKTRTPLLNEADIAIFKIEDAGGDTSAWRQYRIDLRNITDQADLDNVTWPTKP